MSSQSHHGDQAISRGAIVYLTSALALLTACHSEPPRQPPPPKVTALAVPPPATRPQSSEELGLSALARKTSDYAAGVNQALGRRQERQATDNEPANLRRDRDPVAQPRSAATDEEPARMPAPLAWHDVNELRLAPAPPPTTAGAQSNQPVAMRSNQPAALQVAVAPPPPATTPALAPPAAALPRLTGNDSLERTLSGRLEQYPRDASAQLDYQLYQLLCERPAPQLEALTPLLAEDRELIATVIDGLANFRAELRRDANSLLSRKIAPMLEMGDRLKTQAELTIPTASLCTRVDGFGVYEPINPPRFAAGKDHPAIVYCEVANFATQKNDKGFWETKLSQEATLYTESGMFVWQDKSKPIVDLSRNRRHDFFLVKLVRLPANLTIGRYLLKVTVIDQQINRVAEATLPIQIVAEP